MLIPLLLQYILLCVDIAVADAVSVAAVSVANVAAAVTVSDAFCCC